METPDYRTYLYISFQAPSKGALPPGSPRFHRDVPFPEPYFICLSQSPVNDPLLQVPQRDPYGKRFQFPEPSFPYLPESE